MRLSDINNQQQGDIFDKYNQLKDLPKEDLTTRLFEEVARQKREGTYNSAQLYATLEQMKSYIPEATYQNMKTYLDSFNEKK